MGTAEGKESELVPAAGYTFRTIKAKGIPRELSIRSARGFFSILGSSTKSYLILRENKPHVVLGTGGYVSAPVVRVAASRKIPTIIHEQNSIPGLANKMLGKIADVVAISFPNTKQLFPSAKDVIFTGNPVRERVLKATYKEAAQAFELKEDRKTILVFGGSRGAHNLNKAILGCYEALRNYANLQVIHATGEDDYSLASTELMRLKQSDDKLIYKYYPYLDDIGLAYAGADLVISRAGATTIAEISARGVPAILIPYPHATAGHQQKNAEILQRAGAAKLVLDKELNPEKLFELIQQTIFDSTGLKQMQRAMRELGRPNASQSVAKLMIEMGEKKEIEEKR